MSVQRLSPFFSLYFEFYVRFCNNNYKTIDTNNFKNLNEILEIQF